MKEFWNIDFLVFLVLFFLSFLVLFFPVLFFVIFGIGLLPSKKL